MSPSYTFENLTLIAGGNPELEIDLLETFLTVSREYIAGMQAAARANDSGAWQHQAHALKGSCLNIGADGLGDICQGASPNRMCQGHRARKILQKIESEFAGLEQAILHFIDEKRRNNRPN